MWIVPAPPGAPGLLDATLFLGPLVSMQPGGVLTTASAFVAILALAASVGTLSWHLRALTVKDRHEPSRAAVALAAVTAVPGSADVEPPTEDGTDVEMRPAA